MKNCISHLTAFCILICLTVVSRESYGQNNIMHSEVHTSYNVKSIANLNSSYKEFSPILFNDQLIFVSDRPYDLVHIGEDRWKKRKFLNVFVTQILSSQNDSIILKRPTLFANELVGINHTGPVAINKKGNKIIYTQVSKIRHQTNKPKLYITELVNGKWTKDVLLNFCEDDFSYGHPCFAENDSIIYFASDRSGGEGGNDLYSSEWNGKSWSAPKNLGKGINTKNDEVFPSYFNHYLYFSSNCDSSLGGLDLFKSKITEHGFSEKENLGATINTSQDDFGICFTKDYKYCFFSSNGRGGIGDDDIFFAKIIETATVSYEEIVGKFTYRTLNSTANGLDVYLVDANGEIIQQSKTNDRGEFIFKKLPGEGEYTIKVISDNPDLELEIIGKNGKAIAFLRSNKNGSFLYKKLEPSLSGTLSLMEVEDTDDGPLGKLSGQFIYEKLPGIYPDGLDVFIVDSTGKIIDRTKTDSYGNFMFRKLSLTENYIVSIGNSDEELVLLVYNSQENVIAELIKDEKGNYTFRKLKKENGSGLSLVENPVDSSGLARHYITLAGQFKFKNLDAVAQGIPFIVVDGNGNILYKGVSDERGFFRVRDLPMVEQYIFQLDRNDESFNQKYILDIYNRRGRSLALLENDMDGKFIFKRLKQEFFYLSEIEAEDIEFIERVPSIYFDSNSSELSADSKKILDRVIKILKTHPKLSIEISGFTDSRADANYNLNLSKKRMLAAQNYLVNNGVKVNRINGTYYGESRLVNNCKDGSECEEKYHQLNRRCEMHIITAK